MASPIRQKEQLRLYLLRLSLNAHIHLASTIVAATRWKVKNVGSLEYLSVLSEAKTLVVRVLCV